MFLPELVTTAGHWVWLVGVLTRSSHAGAVPNPQTTMSSLAVLTVHSGLPKKVDV
jgi:hypothetical protein